MTELVPDPEFDDPAAWSFVGAGASITGGQLQFINASIGSSATIPVIAPVVGRLYTYSINVERAATLPITERVLFGGVEIYNKAGAGDYSGYVIPINNNGLIFQATLAGQWFLDRISIDDAMALDTLPANLYTTLSGHSGIQSLVANTDSPVTYRIDPMQRGHSSDKPFIIYYMIYDSSYNHLSNAGGGGKRNAHIQVSSFSLTHKAAYELAEQVRLAMRDATLFSSVYITTNEAFESDTKLYSVITEYSVMTS